MENILVKDIMIPINEYAVVPHHATLYDAIIALEESRDKIPRGSDPHRAVLVIDDSGKVIGKLGHLAFLKALEPKYRDLGDLSTFSKAELSPEFIKTIRTERRFWQGSFPDIYNRAMSVLVKDVMHPADACINENEPLTEAIHESIMWQSLSILVTKESEIIGILRLSDVYAVVAKHLKDINTA